MSEHIKKEIIDPLSHEPSELSRPNELQNQQSLSNSLESIQTSTDNIIVKNLTKLDDGIQRFGLLDQQKMSLADELKRIELSKPLQQFFRVNQGLVDNENVDSFKTLLLNLTLMANEMAEKEMWTRKDENLLNLLMKKEEENECLRKQLNQFSSQTFEDLVSNASFSNLLTPTEKAVADNRKTSTNTDAEQNTGPSKTGTALLSRKDAKNATLALQKIHANSLAKTSKTN